MGRGRRRATAIAWSRSAARATSLRSTASRRTRRRAKAQAVMAVPWGVRLGGVGGASVAEVGSNDRYGWVPPGAKKHTHSLTLINDTQYCIEKIRNACQEEKKILSVHWRKLGFPKFKKIPNKISSSLFPKIVPVPIPPGTPPSDDTKKQTTM